MATTPRDLGHQGAKGSAGASGSAAAELAAAAQRAQTFAGGSGAAVLSVEDGELVCRAISGSSPAVGTRFPLTASFPGLCVKERKPLKCDEAETDARVEKGAYVALKIKSIVVVPIMQQQNAAGVLAVFSSSASAFHNTHIAILRTMADSTLGALQTVRGEAANGASGPDSAMTDAPAQQAAPVIPEFVVSPSLGAQPRDAVAPSLVVPKAPIEVPSPRPAAITPPAPRPSVRPPAPVMQPVGEPVSPTPPSLGKKEEIVSLAADVGPRPMPPRVTPQATASPRVRPVMNRPAPSRARRYEPPRQKRGFLPFAVAAMLFAAIAAGAWGLYTRRNRPAEAQQQAAPSSAQQVMSAATPSASVAEPVVVADTQPSENSVAVRDVASAELRPTVASANLAVTKHEPEPKAAKPAQHAPRDIAGVRNEHRPAPPPAPTASANPQPEPASAKPALSTPVQLPAEPPLKVALLPNTAPVPALVKATPASLPTLAPAKPPETTPAEIIKRVPPTYPPLALSAHLTGTVTVAATVSKEGRVTAVQVISGPPLFREAATSAVKQWRFKPATVNGAATESTANIVLKFTSGGH